jgi:hypothetical protein
VAGASAANNNSSGHFAIPTRKGQHASALASSALTTSASAMMFSETKTKGRTIMAKAGLYALGFVLLFGVLIIAPASSYGAPYTTSPNPFRP